MFDVFMFFAILANRIAISASAVLILLSVIYIFPNKEMPMIDEAYRYLKYCKIASILFIILACLMIPGENIDADLALYQQAADKCLDIGKQWILFAFANIIISIPVSLKENSQSSLKALNKLRPSAFFIGAVFLIFSFVLGVS